MISIKQYIEYYYNLENINIIKIKEYYRLDYKNTNYLFMPLTRYPIEILQINRVINNDANYDNIVLNIKNQLITYIDGKNYILVRLSKNSANYNLYNQIEKSKIVYLPNEMIDKITKTNWDILWSKKIDYIEYQLNNLDNDNIVFNSVWYYIGMAENAISYVNETLSLSSNHRLYVSHKRINEQFFNNPLNLIVDYRSRDISEYLKYMFLKKEYDYIEIKEKLQKLNLDEFLCRMIYGRLFFVTFYFDIFDSVMNGNKENKFLLRNIINRADEYEDYINSIYDILAQIKKIPRIGWV